MVVVAKEKTRDEHPMALSACCRAKNKDRRPESKEVLKYSH